MCRPLVCPPLSEIRYVDILSYLPPQYGPRQLFSALSWQVWVQVWACLQGGASGGVRRRVYVCLRDNPLVARDFSRAFLYLSLVTARCDARFPLPISRTRCRIRSTLASLDSTRSSGPSSPSRTTTPASCRRRRHCISVFCATPAGPLQITGI